MAGMEPIELIAVGIAVALVLPSLVSRPVFQDIFRGGPSRLLTPSRPAIRIY
jgi:hypothetical protein